MSDHKVLGRASQDINLREVMTLMESTLLPVNCDEPLCRIKAGCRLAGVLFEAQELFMAHVGQYTLADIVAPDSETVYLINAMSAAEDRVVSTAVKTAS